MNVNSSSLTNPEREGMFTKIACFVGSENLQLDLIEACRRNCLAFEKTRPAGKNEFKFL